jgi:hypothetical protein
MRADAETAVLDVARVWKREGIAPGGAARGLYLPEAVHSPEADDQHELT